MSELAEGARLEIVCAVTSGTEGSNPSLSAILVQGFRCPPFAKATARQAGVGFQKSGKRYIGLIGLILSMGSV